MDNKRALILKLIRYFQQVERTDPTYLDFSNDLAISPKTVAKALREHEQVNGLRIERRAGCRNHYILKDKNHDPVQDQSTCQNE
jgi:DNA-binding transcriptional regulator YhcF (GntR family)